MKDESGGKGSSALAVVLAPSHPWMCSRVRQAGFSQHNSTKIQGDGFSIHSGRQWPQTHQQEMGTSLTGDSDTVSLVHISSELLCFPFEHSFKQSHNPTRIAFTVTSHAIHCNGHLLVLPEKPGKFNDAKC